MSKKILLVMADGVEEAEAVIIADVLRRLGLELDLAGLNARPVKGAHNMTLMTDMSFGEAVGGDYDAVVLPGGLDNALTLADSLPLRGFLQKMYSDGKLVGAICAAPIALENAGLLKGKRFTAYPGLDRYFGGKTPEEVPAVADGRIITGRGPGAAFAFAAALASWLGLQRECAELYSQMLVSE